MLGGTLARRSALLGGAFATLASASAAGLWWQLFRRPLPRTRGSLRLAALDGRVGIRRDRWGVPHIRAGSRHDLWFGEGF
jgi:penicillin amidase